MANLLQPVPRDILDKGNPHYIENRQWLENLRKFLNEASTGEGIDHLNLINIGTKSHAELDTHLADLDIHFEMGDIDHTLIQNIGTYSHDAIDLHINDSDIHFTMLDEDDMASDSDTQAATQQSIKAYITSSVLAIDFWQRVGSILSPKNTGDGIAIDAGAEFNTDSGDNDFTIRGISTVPFLYDAGLNKTTITGDYKSDQFAYLNSDTGGGSSCLFLSNTLPVSSGSGNHGIGHGIFTSLTTGKELTAFGNKAMKFATSSAGSVAFGHGAMSQGGLSGNYNIAVGFDAAKKASGVTRMVAIGRNTMGGATTGGTNSTAIGDSALAACGSNDNTGVGQGVGSSCIGTGNALFGRGAMDSATSSSGNTIFGTISAQGITNGDYNIVIGHNSGGHLTTDSYMLVIGPGVNPLIAGNMNSGSERLTINGAHEITKSVTTSAIETITAASYTLDDTNHVVLCDASSNAITINLPTASGNTGLTYVIKKVDSSANAVTIDGNGSQTIDRALTFSLTSQDEVIKIVNDGSNWYII